MLVIDKTSEAFFDCARRARAASERPLLWPVSRARATAGQRAHALSFSLASDRLLRLATLALRAGGVGGFPTRGVHQPEARLAPSMRPRSLP